MFKKKADKKSSNEALVARKNKAEKMNVLVFEPEGGSPYTVDVTPDKGTFELPDKDMSYKIARGSVWIEGGISRTCINAGNPITVNMHTLTGSDVMHPSEYNADIKNNLAQQIVKAAQTKAAWAKATTWGILGLGFVVVLLMFWQIKTIGSGLGELGDSFESMKVIVQNGSSGAASDPSTHQPIAPDGV